MIAVPPALSPACSVRCSDHREHVYVVCYGQPTEVRDRDYLVGERVFDYPISHYVGHTKGAPLRRLWTHGCGSSRKVAAVLPGDEHREQVIKELEACPTCGRSLWYCGESPKPLILLQIGDVVSRGARGRARYRVATDSRGGAQLNRIDQGATEVLGAGITRRLWPHLVLRDREPGSYWAVQQARQDALSTTPRTAQADLERLRDEAYRARTRHVETRMGRPNTART